MFRTKVLVALVVSPVLLVVMYLGDWPLFVLATAIMLIGIEEFYRAMHLKGIAPVNWVGWLCGIGILAAT